MEENKPPPKGRGALLAAALAKMKEQKALEDSSSSTEIPRPRGRAALLAQLQKKYVSTVGADETTTAAATLPSSSSSSSKATSLDEVTKQVEELNIEKTPCNYKGESGKKIPASANYIQLELNPGRGIFEYVVKYEPEVDSKSARIRMVSKLLIDENISKVKVFDGHTLYLPEKLIDIRQQFNAKHPYSDNNIIITIIYTREKKMVDCLHLYNVLFKRIMMLLKYQRVGRQFFDNRDPFKIPQHKLEIWPGYVVSVNEYTDGIMLCLDVQHKVLRTQSALEVMYEIIEQNKQRYKQIVEKECIGTVVLTRYNNKTYVVHDILWDGTPQSTFETNDNKQISFIDYYKQQYNITIQDLEQPLLIHRQTVARTDSSTNKEERIILLVPELSYMTGLKDEMRNDFRVMKDVAEFTRITPNQRMNSLRKFINSINNTPEAKEILTSWGLSLKQATIDLQMRILGPEEILFGKGVSVHGTEQADWTSAMMRNPVMLAIDLKNWILLHTGQDKRQAEEFVQVMMQGAKKMGILVNRPRFVFLPDDRNETYTKILKEYITRDLQIVCIICPTSRDDRYMIIKKICCSQIPIASQVINSRTLRNPKRLPAITQKIALQINCKLGGSLWSLRFPFQKWMICGVDVYHSKTHKGQSVGAFVTNIDEFMTKWYHRVCFHSKNIELSDYLRTLMTNSLQEYFQRNGFYPEKIVIFRDGIGDGDLETCRNIEVQHLLDLFKDMGIETKLIFIIVQKRINARIFMADPSKRETENPLPGSIVDSGITRKYLYDFFLVSQNVRQGTVTPTHYIVLFDNTKVRPDNIQRLTYKMCHMYYNWTGTVRVPAPCQYAHKLAYLIGQCVRTEHAPALAEKLFYL